MIQNFSSRCIHFMYIVEVQIVSPNAAPTGGLSSLAYGHEQSQQKLEHKLSMDSRAHPSQTYKKKTSWKSAL